MQSKVTKEVLDQESGSERSFVLSRSTFAGSGQYAQHSLGKTAAGWTSIKHTIANTIEMNMYGLPVVGPEVSCTNSTDGTLSQEQQQQLCANLMQATSMLPLAIVTADYPLSSLES